MRLGESFCCLTGHRNPSYWHYKKYQQEGEVRGAGAGMGDICNTVHNKKHTRSARTQKEHVWAAGEGTRIGSLPGSGALRTGLC